MPPNDETFRCSVVVGADLPSSNVVSAASILIPGRLFEILGIALNDSVEVITESFVCVGTCLPQPHSSASSASFEVIIVTSIPSRGHYDLPLSPLSRLEANIRSLGQVPEAYEISLMTDCHIANIAYILKLLSCQRMVIRPGSAFTLRYPGYDCVQCVVSDCRPSTCIITRKTLIQVSTLSKPNSISAKANLHPDCALILGSPFVRLCTFLRLPSWRPKGILIHGPPGTGKSLIVDAAGLATNLSVRHVSGSILSTMPFPGDAERTLSELLSTATGIVCIDSIDAIAGKRGGRHSESSRILGQLLTLMSGNQSNDVVLIGITKNPDELDSALRRPGRFDQEIEVTVPDVRQREVILQFYLQGISNEWIRRAAERAVGYSGADLYSLAHECALLAAFNGRNSISQRDIEAAFGHVCVSSSRREVIVKVKPTEWSDIGGYNEIKSKLRRLIEWPIKHPDQYRFMGLHLPRGLLLYGPPGCAKTTLARALVSSSSESWSILKLDAASVYSSFVGDAEATIRRVFKQARSNLPCMLLLDEIDAIVTSRGLHSSGSDRVQERILSTLLNEMDGISGTDQILVVASTNRPHMLDDALLRPGRFDHLFYIGLPDAATRLEILKVHTKVMPLDPSIDLDRYAHELDLYTGAEIENVCREAGLHALRSDIHCSVVSKEDFAHAICKIRPALTPELCQYYQEFSRSAEMRK